jgi:hypothetical protein
MVQKTFTLSAMSKEARPMYATNPKAIEQSFGTFA